MILAKISLMNLINVMGGGEDYVYKRPKVIQTACYFITGAGALMLFLSYCVYYVYSKCKKFNLFGFLIVTSLALQLAAGILVLMNIIKEGSHNRENAEDFFKSASENYTSEDIGEAYDGVMKEFGCCGAANYQDLAVGNTLFFRKAELTIIAGEKTIDSLNKRDDAQETVDNSQIPEVCCKSGSNCTETGHNANNSNFEKGCIDEVLNVLHFHELMLLIFGIILPLLLIIFLLWAKLRGRRLSSCCNRLKNLCGGYACESEPEIDLIEIKPIASSLCTNTTQSPQVNNSCPPDYTCANVNLAAADCAVREKENQIRCARLQMLLEQQLHARDQLLWDQEQVRRTQLMKQDKQFRFKAHQLNTQLDMDNRQLQMDLIRERIQDLRDNQHQDSILRQQMKQLMEIQKQMLETDLEGLNPETNSKKPENEPKKLFVCQMSQKGTGWQEAARRDHKQVNIKEEENFIEKIDSDLPQWIWDRGCGFFHDRGPVFELLVRLRAGENLQVPPKYLLSSPEDSGTTLYPASSGETFDNNSTKSSKTWDSICSIVLEEDLEVAYQSTGN